MQNTSDHRSTTSVAAAHPAYGAYTVTSSDGVRLSVRESGNPAGPAIVFIHGISQCQLAFCGQINSALAARFRLITYDLRGHGESDKPDGDAFYAEGRRWSDDLKAVLDRIGTGMAPATGAPGARSGGKPVLVGWSLGGRVIAQYLEDHGDSALAGIHLVASRTIAGRGTPGLGNAGQLLLDMRATQLEANIAATTAFIHACFNGPLPLSPEQFQTVLAYNMLTPPAVRRATLMWPGDMAQAVAGIAVPTLLAHGTADRIIDPAASSYTLSRVPHARLSSYEGAGHALFLDEAGRFNRELAAFVDAAQAG